jgi:hypothetical protein
MLHDAADAGATDASMTNASPGAPARSRSCAAVCTRTQEHDPHARKVCRRHAVAARSVVLPCPVGQACGSLLQE